MEKGTIEKILEIEKRMFLTVKSIDESPCQKDTPNFLLHRRAQFFPWSNEVLRSYLHDLELASQQGNNLMTLKYARMEEKIPVLNNNPLIEKIVVISRDWQEEMIEHYPYIMDGGRPLDADDQTVWVSYPAYLKAELETYSDITIQLLYNHSLLKKKQGINMSKEVYQFLVSMMGYKSLDDAETIMRKKRI